MKNLKKIVTSLHRSTKRNYLARMIDNKVECMEEAKNYGENYWDGDRRYGYGGYKYIPNYWKPIAEQLINIYNLGPGSKVLDVGCGKGFLLYEMILLEPKLNVYGIDISNYGIRCAHDSVKSNLFIQQAQTIYPFKDNEFDLVISLGTLHNLKFSELSVALQEIDRTGKEQYIMVESYRNNLELFNLQCWALTCESFYDDQEWLWIFKQFGYNGDYEFIYFE